MHTILQDKTNLTVSILSLLLVVLQIIFGFLMRKKREAFIKYHKVLGALILLIVIANVFLFPESLIIAVAAIIAILAQIFIGIALSKGKKQYLKFHKPLGTLVFILVIVNLVLAFP